VGFEPQILTEHKVDIFPVFLSNEPDTLRRLGYQVKLFEAADYGAPTLGLTYIATEAFIDEKPDVVLRFLKAVLKGIQYASSNRQEAVDIVLQFAPQEDRAHQQYMLETELQAALLGQAYQNGTGWQTAEQWKALHDFLVQYEGISGPLPDPAAAFTDRFVKQAYKNGQLVWP
jgi:ABC-type nitrate/sulfonate/bicarbonate transport system substrate-binding protein